MQVSVESTSSLERKVRVELPEDRISSEVSNRLQNMTKTTKIQGFRPGKVPLKIIQGRYGDQVRKEVVGELVQSSLYEAISQESLKPAGQPRIDELNDEVGKDLAYTAVFEIYPEVKLKPMSKIKVEKPVCEVTKNDVDGMIEMLRKQRRELKPVERAAKDGDIVNINFEGFIDGKVFDGGKAENHDLELGSKGFIEGFEEGLIGKSAGDDVTLDLKFPDEYGNEELKGKQTEFKVKVNLVNETVLPEVDEAFMEQFGVKDGKEETLLTEIKRNMDREVELTLRRQLKDGVFESLREANEVELPHALVHNEQHRVKHELENNLKQQGLDGGAIAGADDSVFKEQAEKRVSLQLIVGEIIKENELKADPAKVREMIEQAASGYEDPNSVVNWYYSDQKNLAEVEALALEDGVIDWILEHADVTDKACTFDEVMNKGQTAV
ncbi:MAG TPA: trigger factor [Thiotrichaceae bacterium]|jgi:trigger factor|nr:trigger factor [Thiotrichaceae bacterium]HIM08310.1 trigger factor [Gammaproteobacteria bacterium]